MSESIKDRENKDEAGYISLHLYMFAFKIMIT
jgi:hypothetical protein